MNIIDLSISIKTSDWEPTPVKLDIVDHRKGANMLGQSYLYFSTKGFLKKLYIKIFRPRKYIITYKDFPDEMGLSLMTYTLTTHTGTHIDAPFHYGWHKSDKLPRTITDIPLEWFYGNGVVLNCKDINSIITANDIKRKLSEINYKIEPGDIILLNTGTYLKAGTKDYFSNYPSICTSALDYLISNGVKVIGTDTFSFDRPFCEMLQEYYITKNKNVLWPAHFFGRDHEYLQIERLNNLDQIPINFGFKVSCFPIKLDQADASWSRVVAIVD